MRTIAILSVAMAGLVAASAVQAQPFDDDTEGFGRRGRRQGRDECGPRQMEGRPPMRNMGPLLKGLRKLGLSEEQKDAIRGIVFEHREEIEATIGEIGDARKAVFEAIHADTFDEKAVRQAFRKASLIEEDLAVLRASIVQQVREELTPEQTAQLSDLRKKGGERFAKQREMRRKGIEKWLDRVQAEE